MLLKCLKSHFSEHLSTVDMLKGPKDWIPLEGSIFVRFFDYSNENKLKKFCFNSIWNLETVCQHIDIRWQDFSLSKSECLTQPIQIVLSQNEKIFSEFFFCISGIYIKFGILWNKILASHLFVSKITDFKKRAYLNA